MRIQCRTEEESPKYTNNALIECVQVSDGVQVLIGWADDYGFPHALARIWLSDASAKSMAQDLLAKIARQDPG